MTFIALLAMVLLALKPSGWLLPESGGFSAIDGDSLRKGGTEYRLHAIDAPELHQTCTSSSGADYPCGREAHDELKRLVAGHDLQCLIIDTDRYGRLVAKCGAGNLDINREMVRRGWAIAYRSHGLEYVGAEDEARRASRSLWQGRFELPETWRAAHRNGLAKGAMVADFPPD